MYEDSDPIDSKIEKIAKRIYRAEGVDFLPAAQQKIEQFTRDGLTGLSICMAKTHLSLSADAALANAPTGYRIPVRDIRPYTGAGFLTALCGDIMQMPGLGVSPAGFNVDIDENGKTVGLFYAHGDPYLGATVEEFLDGSPTAPRARRGRGGGADCAMAAGAGRDGHLVRIGPRAGAVHERARELRRGVRRWRTPTAGLRRGAGGAAHRPATSGTRSWTRRWRGDRLAHGVLEIASEVATLAADIAETGNRNLEGDALTGALLAEAASRSAATLAQLNVSMLSRHAMIDAHLENMRPALARATRARERAVSAYAHV